jgi:DNA repair protein RecN (Recombination protein N)
MLRELRVENLLLIERAELRLSEGLNVLTGETGAGKTVLAQALDLLLGGRPHPSIVRPGAREAYVEGVFDLPADLPGALSERLPMGSDEIVLARRVGSDGRTRAYLNGRTITVAELRDHAPHLLTFYGQHEHRKLTLAGAQLEILDSLCGPAQAGRLRSCAEAFAEVGRLNGRLEELRALSLDRDRELDLLEFELAEIEAVDPSEEERLALLKLRERLRRLDALCSAAQAGADALAPDSSEAPGAGAMIAAAAAQLDALAGVDPQLDSLAERLRSLLIESGDLAGELRSYAEHSSRLGPEWGGDADSSGGAASLDQVEERLAAIDRLIRKHGSSVDDVLAHRARARARRDQLAGAEVALADTAQELAGAEAALGRHVDALRAARAKAGSTLARAVREQLSHLAMGEASFEVSLSERPAGPSGGDAVDFTIAPNPGVPAGPLREIASGGELSRVMLAIMSVPGASPGGATMVFDEVDAGIGGHTAHAVGARLSELAESRQVLCITHLPQIASLADRHFSIAKDTSADPTLARVLELDEPEVVSELVRMLGADSADTVARRHAQDLRRAA